MAPSYKKTQVPVAGYATSSPHSSTLPSSSQNTTRFTRQQEKLRLIAELKRIQQLEAKVKQSSLQILAYTEEMSRTTKNLVKAHDEHIAAIDKLLNKKSEKENNRKFINDVYDEIDEIFSKLSIDKPDLLSRLQEYDARCSQVAKECHAVD